MDQSTVVSIIFLVIAIVVLMRLGSVLGRRTGNEPSPYDTQMNRTGAPSGRDNVVQLPGRNQNAERAGDEIDLENLARYAEPDTPLFDGLKDIAAHDLIFERLRVLLHHLGEMLAPGHNLVKVIVRIDLPNICFVGGI